jgi:hypothetical protein
MNPEDRHIHEDLTTADIASRPARAAQEHAHHALPPGQEAGHDSVALFPNDEVSRLKSTWTEIQSHFVDEPRRSVEEADGLVASTIQRLAESFAQARAHLEAHWSKGDDVSTEELRQTLQRYHSFFERLLAV